jgi:uncharacterized protein (TIGR03437 family)
LFYTLGLRLCMRVNQACAVLLACSSLFGDSPTVYVGDRYEHRIAAVAADTSGNTYVTGGRYLPVSSAGALLPGAAPEVFVAKLDATNRLLWVQYFSGKQQDSGTAVTVDAEGNVYVAGSTTSVNFPLRDPFQDTPGGFVMKLAPDGSRVLWSSYFGPVGTEITSMSLAPDGTLVLGGQTGVPFGDFTAFVAKLDRSGSGVVWQREFRGTRLACTSGSSCFLTRRINTASIAVDPSGNIYAAGNTNTVDFPTTPGAFLEKGYGPYIRKFSPSGEVLWSTYITDNRVGSNPQISPADILRAVAAGPDGSVYFAGGGSPNWPTTPGAYREEYEGPEWGPYQHGQWNTYVARMNASGTAFVYSTFTGHTVEPTGRIVAPSSLAVASQGNAYVSGTGAAFVSGDYIAALNSSGSELEMNNGYALESRGAAIALEASSRIHAAGAGGLVTVFDPDEPPSGIAGLLNAAGAVAAGRVAPGELITIYGWDLGDQVFVDELPAPVLYASSAQMNAIVPFGVSGRKRVTVSVRRNGAETAQAELAIVSGQPELFKDAHGYAAALNEDGTLNSKDNPAKSGSVITVWGTGAGGWAEGTQDGSFNAIEPLVSLPLSVAADNQQTYLQVEFAGAAPGMVAGVFQMNVRLPEIWEWQTFLTLHVLSDGVPGGPAYVYVTR